MTGSGAETATELAGTTVPVHGRWRVGADSRRGEVLTTRVGLQMPSDLSFDAWQRAGGQLAGVVDSSSWWLGDWLVFGKDHYSDRYQLGIRTAGLKYQTLRNYAWVSRRFDFQRRRDSLTFQHHAEVASLPIEKQEMWLDRAEQKGWSTKQLRNSIRAANSVTAPERSQLDMVRQLTLPGSRINWWHRAAEHSGVDFEKWVLVTLDNAAELALDDMDGVTAISA
ncbi:LmbU family transcriptional regulator [Kitasatospora sp. NPDC053057]|uniref:LmbU family transcriptional regulator n=1 Tax=Kitasatospora sp. NPDC053057 TaxID=3364062 RepID=UPI0037C7CD7D